MIEKVTFFRKNGPYAVVHAAAVAPADRRGYILQQIFTFCKQSGFRRNKKRLTFADCSEGQSAAIFALRASDIRPRRAICDCVTRYVRFANEGKYHIAFRIAKYIATAKAVISHFAARQNISLFCAGSFSHRDSVENLFHFGAELVSR